MKTKKSEFVKAIIGILGIGLVMVGITMFSVPLGVIACGVYFILVAVNWDDEDEES